MSATPSTAVPDISVVLPTYNREADLLRALNSVLAQRAPGCSLEIIVVDNNSSDGTRAAIERVIAGGASHVRYVFEPRQGVSYARNSGIAAVRAPIVAFLDDDICVAEDWIAHIWRAFEERPDLECIGGKVLPAWTAPPPAWLTRDHWAPLALLDFGDAPVRLTASNRLCLLTANLACRRSLLDRIGVFRPELQRVKDGIGSMEDHEWMLRVWDSGAETLYLPELVAFTDVPFARTTKAYHRRWHGGHGRFFAQLRDPVFEASHAGRLYDVPAHVFRSIARDALGWLKRIAAGDLDGAFTYETKLRFQLGYVANRRAEYRAQRRQKKFSAEVEKLELRS